MPFHILYIAVLWRQPLPHVLMLDLQVPYSLGRQPQFVRHLPFRVADPSDDTLILQLDRVRDGVDGADDLPQPQQHQRGRRGLRVRDGGRQLKDKLHHKTGEDHHRVDSEDRLREAPPPEREQRCQDVEEEYEQQGDRHGPEGPLARGEGRSRGEYAGQWLVQCFQSLRVEFFHLPLRVARQVEHGDDQVDEDDYQVEDDEPDQRLVVLGMVEIFAQAMSPVI